MIDGPCEGNGRRPALLLVENLGLAVLAYRRGVEPEALARSFGVRRAALDRLGLGLPAALAGVTHVNVYFDVLSDTQKAALQQKLLAFAAQKGIAVTVVELPENIQGISRGGAIVLSRNMLKIQWAHGRAPAQPAAVPDSAGQCGHRGRPRS